MKKQNLILIASAVLLGVAATANAQVQIPNPIGIQTIPQLIVTISTYIAGIVGALAVIMFIWAGILFLTSGIYEHNLEKAKETLYWAVIGLAIALSGAGLIALVQKIISG